MTDTYRFNLEIAAKDAVRELTVAKAGASDLTDELDDTGSAAKKLATVLDRAAGEMEDELTRATRAGVRMGEALGPELARKIGQTRINEWVADLRKAGVEIDDIEANARELATSLARLEDVRLTATTQGFHQVAEGADRARNVTSNFVGNAVQELPGISGAFAPVNMAISQMAEGLAAGEIGLKQAAAQAGPIAGLAAMVALLAKAWQDAAEFRRKEREAAEAVIDDDFAAGAKELVSLYGELYKAADQVGISSETVTRALLGNTAAGKEFRDALLAAGHTTDVFVMVNANRLVTTLDTATESWQSNTDAITRNRGLEEEVQRTLEGLDATSTKFGETLDDTTRKYSEMERAIRGVIAAQEAHEEAGRRAVDALDNEDAYQNTMLSLDELRGELEAIAKAEQDGEITHEQAMRKAALAINDKRRAVIDYLHDVLGIPLTRATEIAADITGAEQSIADVKAMIDELTGTAYEVKFSGTFTPPPKWELPTTGSSGKFNSTTPGRTDAAPSAGTVIVMQPAGADPARWQTEQRRWLRRQGTTS